MGNEQTVVLPTTNGDRKMEIEVELEMRKLSKRDRRLLRNIWRTCAGQANAAEVLFNLTLLAIQQSIRCTPKEAATVLKSLAEAAKMSMEEAAHAAQ